MHRTFQRDLAKLRLTTARAYVKVLTDGQVSMSSRSPMHTYARYADPRSQEHLVIYGDRSSQTGVVGGLGRPRSMRLTPPKHNAADQSTSISSVGRVSLVGSTIPKAAANLSSHSVGDRFAVGSLVTG